MSDKSQKPTIDRVFLIEEILPDAAGFFEEEPLGIEKALESADIVLDTNVLLIPYGAGQSSLSQIVSVYESIKNKGRLFVPAQVAREFVKNRPNKLAQLYQGISDQVSKFAAIERLSYPILDSVSEFKVLNDIIEEIGALKSRLKSTSKDVRQEIKNWGVNDPVSQAYRPVFTRDVIIDPKIDKEKTLEEMFARYEYSIPPGYKDKSKPDAGIGDYLIWKTILSLGAGNKRSLVFVSGDEKADWLHGAEGSGFLPRYELQAEFRRVSNGCDFYIIPLSRLLELQKAEASTVVEVKTEEVRIKNASTISAECPECDALGEYELSESVGSSALPVCVSCLNKFHLHRTSIGVSTSLYRGAHHQTHVQREKSVEIVSCPACGTENLKELGVSAKSTAWCICDECNKKFPIHRKFGGLVYVNSNYEE
ncbi:PIN domain-containing protein [Pseudomonas yamanorum]|uniref:PIN domain-containing protein n=1 Tax=Pseudomonas yamanorum TaxID=515393 RepID=UPI003D364AFF